MFKALINFFRNTMKTPDPAEDLKKRMADNVGGETCPEGSHDYRLVKSEIIEGNPLFARYKKGLYVREVYECRKCGDKCEPTPIWQEDEK